jgi:hypothetical protein
MLCDLTCENHARSSASLLLAVGEKFPYVFKAALRAAREAHFTGRPRLAASLPARPGGGHRETRGHGEAQRPPTDGDAGLRVEAEPLRPQR